MEYFRKRGEKNKREKEIPSSGNRLSWAFARDCRLKEIPSSGNRLSWAGVREIMSNGVKEKVWVQCRLDRAFGNAEWFRLFPNSHSFYLEKTGSDHRPIFTGLDATVQRRTGRFTFDKRWCAKPGIQEIIRRGWSVGNPSGEASVSERIRSCRMELSKWKRTANVNSNMSIMKLRRELEVEESKIRPDLARLPMMRLELEKAYQEEETFWQQRSKNSWLRVGDKNTKVFHGWVESRRMKNKVHSLISPDGSEHFDEDMKGKIAVDYFTDLFTSNGSASPVELLEGMTPRVTERMNRDLIKPVSDAEIKSAVKAIKCDSSPGVDGMTGHFFQKFWNITGQQVTKEVRNFFESGQLPMDWNFTELCLLPKVLNPNQMKDLRPISLCSVVYKIVSKVMCDRLKTILPHIISPAQGAFVGGRLISDNLLIAHEMVHGLRTNPMCKSDFIAIKTDMSKAYDRVEWNFLEALFSKLGFHSTWIAWIMSCVRSVSYSVLLNGQAYGHITPQRGIRQGDPLSPFLFILCAEALIHTMNQGEQNGRITCMKIASNCPSVQHLLFADDSFFLCRATLAECSEFLRRLKLYGDSSGQVINFQKSAITYGAGIDAVMKRVLAEFLGIENEGGDGKYLGLPECFSGSKQKLLAFIGEKLNKRLRGWFAKKLSLGGKEVLLKSIAMALPVYAMSCFRLIKHHCQKIMSAMASFWWDECGEKRKIHWISWKKMCISKENGGLGFRDMEDFNQALLAKQAWRLLNNPESLIAQIYKGRYFNNRSFMDCGKGIRPSYAWRSILFGRDLLQKGLIKSIGDGASTFVWSEKWIMDDTPRRPVSKQIIFDANLKVSALINSDGSWNVNLLNELFPINEVQRITQLPTGASQDREIWAFTPNGSYSVKSGYSLAAQEKEAEALGGDEVSHEVLELKRLIWKAPTVPKIRSFLWRAASGALAVAERLNTRGMNVEANCKLCSGANESIAHVLFLCPVAQDIWARMGFTPVVAQSDQSLSELLLLHLKLMTEPSLPVAQRQTIPWIFWTIWKNRNSVLYAETQISIEVQLQLIRDDARLWTELNDSQANEETVNGLLEEAIGKAIDWPRYRIILSRIQGLCAQFPAVAFQLKSPISNRVAREIAKSVLRDGRFQSYLALGGPAWLHHLINREAAFLRS
ncbi:uncharacterized protein LOC130504548 [Raphanus sativus]|uniref:Uncharacterized protein LOC130504548 n=1 Tax=Raphanus sativus TaxID=3726 RepID=A0A9W3CU37_RAPSA|nr:uncharacterized protein LOC130504548 [Raphanus sativus]